MTEVPPKGCICIIPARKGSRRVPNKNMRMFCGKPLVQWTIEAAIESGIFDMIIVSSDNMKTLELAFDFFDTQIIQPHRRPKNLCGDDVDLREVCIQIFRTYGVLPEFCLLQPTSPLRTSDDIKRAYEQFKGHDFLISVSQLDEDTFKYDNGAINFANVPPFLEEGTWYGKKSVPFLLPTIDIDEEGDFIEAEKAMRKMREANN